MFRFEPATRQNVGLLIGLAGGTGSGKSYSAMELATGICGSKPFAVIDTEAGRARHYAESFRFDHGDLRAPFTPDAYIEAILAAEKAGYPVIVVDSMSHEHAGDGGLLDMHEAELDRMARDDFKKRESCKMTAWIAPKMAHKRFVQKLLQLRSHVILCFRAEEKISVERENGRMVVRPMQSAVGLDGWIPIAAKGLPFELTASFLLLANNPGVPLPIKLQEQHRAAFPLDRPIGRAAGEAIAAWAAGGTARKEAPTSPTVGQPAPPVNQRGLEEVLTGIALAESMTELDTVTPYASMLPEADKSLARAAFVKRKSEIESQRQPGE
jgi:hypothetical protein